MYIPEHCRLRALMLLSVLVIVLTGCAEGPFSRLGGLNPWVREKWAEEERIVQTLYGRREQLRDLADRARSLPPAEQERVSQELADLLRDEPVTLLRIEAVRALTAFPTVTASAALGAALRDKEADVRVAACKALSQRRDADAIPALQQVLGSDTDIDVRLAATQALGSFRNDAAIQALGIALDDSDPALQFRAIESLRRISGRDYGYNVVTWREYVRGGSPPSPGPSLVELLRNWF